MVLPSAEGEQLGERRADGLPISFICSQNYIERALLMVCLMLFKKLLWK